MSNALFPLLPGIRSEREKAPAFETIVHRSSSGRRLAMGKRFFPVWKFKLTVDVLRAGMGYDELQELQGFFLNRRGALDDFLYQDRDVNALTTPQVFGVGDGTTTAFQLVHNIGGFVDRVGAVNGTPVVRIAGTPSSAFTVDDNGLLTFTAAPAAGAQLDWTGSFYYRVAFVRDEMNFRQFLKDLHSTGVEMETV